MTFRILFPLAFAVVASTAACNSNNTTTPSQHDEMVGSWISTGSDVARGLAAADRVAQVKATFNADYTFTIVITDSTNSAVSHTGTWTASGAQHGVRSITLSQTSPSMRVEQGVFQVSGARLTYEVVATDPAADGTTPPTIAAGFGSTLHNGATDGSTWIQRFWNAEADIATPPCNTADSLSVLSKRPCDGHRWTAETDKGR